MTTPYPLGRIKSPLDDRNFRLSFFLDRATPPTKLEALLDALKHNVVLPSSLKSWATEVTARLEALTPKPPIPLPPLPPPIPTTKRWATASQLDQKDTGHCVGFSWAQWGNCEPIVDNYLNIDGDDLYYAAKVFDGEAKAENGSTLHSGAKAMAARKRIGGYAWSTDLEEIKKFVLTQGPLAVATYFTNDMGKPDALGFVHPTGGIAGGHAYYICGYDRPTDAFAYQNSWGPDWGDKGFFYMYATEWWSLFSYKNDGEACAAVELAL